MQRDNTFGKPIHIDRRKVSDKMALIRNKRKFSHFVSQMRKHDMTKL